MRELLIKTLENRFDHKVFKKFALELLKKSDMKEEEISHISSNFSSHIAGCFLLAEFTDQKRESLDVLTVKAKGGSKVERARSMQRNFVADYLKKRNKIAALAAFYNEDSPVWRLSFIKLDYRFDEKGKVQKELTPAKRYSFLVGEGEPSHTAEHQLLGLLQQEEAPLVSEIEGAFNIEKVTKEFFTEYRNLFEMLIKELKSNYTFQNEAVKSNIDVENFAKKLLGQIVFLYFLQKKGWLGVPQDKKWGEGDKFFLRHLFERAKNENKNFFNDYLRILFYDTLNNPRRNTADPSYSKEFNSRIPFLNGGLFEPDYDWEKSFVYLEDNIFEEILGVFDLYNFTVKEDEPLEKEVAVDPEMLGKVFENLLEENLRKGKGTYYTPREIVHYMCQESLINYLSSESKIGAAKVRKLVVFAEQDDQLKAVSLTGKQITKLEMLLKDIKIVDPACGSGAFLVGMLQGIVKTRKTLELMSKMQNITPEYQLRKETIQDCIYGVDIDPGAVEIAKLRLWLSLVVDYELEDIEPLPNLDYKVMQGNSLLEEFEGIKFFEGNESPGELLIDHEREKKKEELKEKKLLYFSISDDKEKEVLRKEIKELIDWFVVSALERGRQLLTRKKRDKEAEREQLSKEHREEYWRHWSDKFLREGKIDDLLKKIHDPRVEKPFFLWGLNFMEVFEEKGGFDVVIANPPYVDSENMTKDNEKFREILSSIYKTAKGNWDLFIVFIERGLQLLRTDATITYIVPNKLVAARYSEKLRGMLLAKNILEIRDYSNANVFKEVDVYPIVFLIQNNNNRNDVVMSVMQSETELKLSNKVPAEVFYKDIHWGKYFSPKEVLDILLKMSEHSGPGLLSGGVSDAATVSEAYQIKEYLIEKSPRHKEGYKKLINTGSIDRYVSLWGKQKTQYIKNGYMEPVISDKDLKKISATRFQQATSEKIIIAGMSKELECFYDTGKYLAGKSTTTILRDNLSKEVDLKYTLALLNSNLVSFWFQKSFGALSLAGGYLQINNKEIEKIPIPVADSLTQKKFTSIVDKIITITKSDDYLENSAKQAKVHEYEKQIDQLVYKLYGLTPEEIKIVEDKK